MKKFKYRAKKGPDEFIEGFLLAESQDEAVDRINNMGLLPVDLREEHANSRQPEARVVLTMNQKRAKTSDLVIFYRQLAILVQSGVPILRALAALATQFEKSRMGSVVAQIRDDVRQGQNLSEALIAFPAIFSSFDVAMVHAGESVGQLEKALLRLSEYKDQEESVRSKVKSAIAYPAFVVVMGFFSVMFMLSFVIPKFSLFFEDLGQDLPVATQILISISDWCKTGWMFIIPTVVLGYYLAHRAMRHKSEKILFDQLLLRTPKFGDVVLKSEVSQLARALELLIGSGLQLLTAIKLGRGVLRNEVIKKEFEACYRLVADGGKLSEALVQSNRFPSMMIQLVSLGEETGKLDEALGQVASWYEREVETNIKVMTTLLEPIIILTVGLILGLIVIAVLLPVFSMNAIVP